MVNTSHHCTHNRLEGGNMTDMEDTSTGFTLVGGVMSVYALGGDASDTPLVDEPDVARHALGIFDSAFTGAGGKIAGNVHALKPDGGLRLIRSDHSHGGGATSTGTGGSPLRLVDDASREGDNHG